MLEPGSQWLHTGVQLTAGDRQPSEHLLRHLELPPKLGDQAGFSHSGVAINIDHAGEFDNEPLLVYKFKAEKFLNPAQNLRIVPVLDEAYLDHKLISKEERKFPIDFEGFYTTTANISVALPENLAVKYLPSPIDLKNPWFSLRAIYEDKGDQVDFKQEFTIKKILVAQEDYRRFKASLKEALYLLRGQIILEKK